MEPTIRTGRTFGVTAELTPVQRRNLHNLLHSEIWPDLCDVLEMVCIETETVLINTDPAEKARVLESHKMAKAAWQIFEHMQQRVHEESNRFLASITAKPFVPPVTAEELEQDNLLSPILPLPADYDGIM